MGTEVITTTDKEQRDRMFEDLRKNGNEPVLAEDGLPKTTIVQYKGMTLGGKISYGKEQIRILYRSNWSVAYPNGIIN